MCVYPHAFFFKKSDGYIVDSTVHPTVHLSVRPSCCLLLNHLVEFNQTCYMTSPHGMGGRLPHYFPVHPSGPSCCLLLNHWVEFNQICYMTFSHGKGLREQYYFSIRCPAICPSCYSLPNHWVEFDQTCYMASFHCKGVREWVCPSVRPSVLLVTTLAWSMRICDGAISSIGYPKCHPILLAHHQLRILIFVLKTELDKTFKFTANVKLSFQGKKNHTFVICWYWQHISRFLFFFSHFSDFTTTTTTIWKPLFWFPDPATLCYCLSVYFIISSGTIRLDTAYREFPFG